MTPLTRARVFADRFGLETPILMAPMAGACPPALAAAVADGGGMGAVGALLLTPAAIAAWAAEFRHLATSGGKAPLQMNLWVPDPPPERDATHEKRIREFLSQFGPEVPADAGDTPLIDFDEQCDALLAARPTAVSSIMGLFPAPVIERCKREGIAWFACATTVEEARAAEAAGADVIVAQGAEAGGHRGSFEAEGADQRAIGLFALLPQVVDAVSVPVVATGGIADARGVAAALALGASAVQIGTGLLRCPESGIPPVWSDALARTGASDTQLTRAFSGRWGRAIATEYVRAAALGPEPAPYPVQRAMTAGMRTQAGRLNDVQTMQVWSGQGAKLAQVKPVATLMKAWWQKVESALR